jgi:hypothetical protein
MPAYAALLNECMQRQTSLHVARLSAWCDNRLQLATALKQARALGIELKGVNTLDAGLQKEYLGMASPNPRAY